MGYPNFKIHQGDCLTWLPSQAEGSFQLLVLDPPYNVGFRYGKYRDTKPRHVYLNEQLLVLAHCEGLLREGGSILYLNYPEMAGEIWARVDFLKKFEMIQWVYPTHLGGYPLRKASRTWLWFSKGEPLVNPEAFQGEYRNPEDPRIKARIEKGLKPVGFDWMDTGQVRNTSREKREHPCQVPESMVEKFILGTTNTGDLVGDCYTGSGTTAICAVRHGREFSGCELDPTYIQVAQKALDQEVLATGQMDESNSMEIRRVI